MDDHNSISYSDNDSDGDGDGDSDSSVNSISSSSNSEDESNRIIATNTRSKRSQTKASKSLQKKSTQLPPTTRKNRSSSNNNDNVIKNKTRQRNDEKFLNNSNKNDAAQSLQSNNPRRSKLAREHRITATQEQEIYEVFHLFAEENSSTSTTSTTTTSGAITGIASKKGKRSASTAARKGKTSKKNIASVAKIHIRNLRSALIALSLTPTVAELKEYISILDPEEEGMVEYEPFVAICALKINSRIVNSEDHQREVDEAWELFVKEGNDRITVRSLREVARSIGEDGVSDELLRDMVLEANGGAGLARGVEKGEFEDVMRKAGVWR